MTFSDILNNGFATAYIIKNGGSLSDFGLFLTILAILLCCAVGYFIGSINFAIILSKKYHKDDVRQHGSKNAGATNMLRTFGKKAAFLTFLGDFLKAVVVCFIGRLCWGLVGAYLAGLFCVLGHVFPIFFKFKGGKGVATTAGVMFACDIGTFLIIFFIYAGVFFVSQMVSLASVMSALMYTLVLFEMNKLFGVDPGFHTVLAFIISVVVIVKHVENIKRIINNTEPRVKLFGKKKSKENDPDTPNLPNNKDN